MADNPEPKSKRSLDSILGYTTAGFGLGFVADGAYYLSLVGVSSAMNVTITDSKYGYLMLPFVAFPVISLLLFAAWSSHGTPWHKPVLLSSMVPLLGMLAGTFVLQFSQFIRNPWPSMIGQVGCGVILMFVATQLDCRLRCCPRCEQRAKEREGGNL